MIGCPQIWCAACIGRLARTHTATARHAVRGGVRKSTQAITLDRAFDLC
jgi:hypothetical protein